MEYDELVLALSKRRVALKYTTRQVAWMTGFSNSQLSRYENYKSVPSAKNLFRWVEALGVTITIERTRRNGGTLSIDGE